MQKILAVSLTALGDTLLCLPALTALRRANPKADIRFAVPPTLKPLFTGHPLIDGVMAVSLPQGKNWEAIRSSGSLVRELRRFAPEIAFVFTCNRDILVPLLRAGGVRRVYMVPNRSRFRALLSNTALVPSNDIDISEHGMEDRLRVIRAAGIEAVASPLDLPVRQEWVEEASAWVKSRGLEDQHLVIFQVYTSLNVPKAGELPGAKRRHWPRERYAKVALELIRRFPDVVVVATGSPDERPACEEMVDIARDPRVVASAGELSLPGVVGLLSMAKLLLTPDTGVMHLAHAIHMPTVCLYSLSDVHRTQRLDTEPPHRIVKRIPPDWPNSSREDIENCMIYISVNEVVQACVDVLEQALEQGSSWD